MPTGTLEFKVDRPPHEVFALLADLERAPEWVPDLVSVEKLTPGPVGIGTRYSEVVQMGKRTGEASLEVTEFNPPRVFAHKGEGGPSRFSARFTVEPDGEGSRVRHDYEVAMTGVFKLMSPLMGRWVRRNADAAIEGFRRMAEAGESPASTSA